MNGAITLTGTTDIGTITTMLITMSKSRVTSLSLTRFTITPITSSSHCSWKARKRIDLNCIKVVVLFGYRNPCAVTCL